MDLALCNSLSYFDEKIPNNNKESYCHFPSGLPKNIFPVSCLLDPGTSPPGAFGAVFFLLQTWPFD